MKSPPRHNKKVSGVMAQTMHMLKQNRMRHGGTGITELHGLHLRCRRLLMAEYLYDVLAVPGISLIPTCAMRG